MISGQVFENSQFVYPASEIVCLSVLIIVEINLWEPTLNDLRVKLLNAVQRGGAASRSETLSAVSCISIQSPLFPSLLVAFL